MSTQNKIQLALCLIVKGSDDEAVMLEECLSHNAKDVDKVFITITHLPGQERNKAVEAVALKYNAEISDFEWIYDFSAARNFNFSQVPKEYDYIVWEDADDAIRGLEKFREIAEQYPDVDVFTTNYLYSFNEFKQPTVVHMKSQIIKNNGCVEWFGKLHEDFKENRETKRFLIKGIERIHLTNETRIESAKLRNVEVSKKAIDTDPEDPRMYWNYANSLFGAQKWRDSKEQFKLFLNKTNSEEEKYIAYIRLCSLCEALGERNEALDYGRMAIGLRPSYPDAYHALGQIFAGRGIYQMAVHYITEGLVKKPPYYSIVVYNPREYDFHPTMLLAKCLYQLSRPDQALECLYACRKMQPDNEEVKGLIVQMEKDKEFFDSALKTIKRLSKIKKDSTLKKAIDALPLELKSHPGVCKIKNDRFIKKESSGKDISIFCGYTDLPWSPSYAKEKGVGGSEEAILNLAKQWSLAGWNVEVYANIPGTEEEDNGVKYKPFWSWNAKDKQDVTIFWRSPKMLDYEINSDKILIDVHDVISEGEFTPARLKKIHKIMVKTKFHRDLFPNIPDEKFAVIPNGMDFELFSQDIKKDQYLVVNTSSPDRSMDVTPELFKEIKKQVPQAKMKWAYGFDLFDKVHATHPVMMKWSDTTKKAMEEAGIENLGRLSQKECAKLYLEGNVLFYPTEFAEIDCITIKKAQACGAIPVTTDFGALDESVKTGVKIHSHKTKDDWASPNQFHFGVSDETVKKQLIDAVVKQLQTPIGDRTEMKEKMKFYEWPNIANKWIEIMK